MSTILGTAIVLIVLVAIVALIIVHMVRSKRKGKSLQCGMDCKCCCGCNFDSLKNVR
ncbi:MAG: FeoB-associated Cys-rich membrane protein [Eubacterium sp.]|nr:FeoB-associated Cys-rich membrane protein [Eubacterium sp.]